MIDPKSKDTLTRFTMVAKGIIYKYERAKTLISMLGTKEGAMQAVSTVMAIIEKSKPVPDNLAPLLAVNTYLLLVEVAQKSTMKKADPGIMHDVMEKLMQGVAKASEERNAYLQSKQQPAQPQGIIGRQVQGAVA